MSIVVPQPTPNNESPLNLFTFVELAYSILKYLIEPESLEMVPP
jgi:hypothetical protein